MREWNLYWPAVSQSCILRFLFSTLTVLLTKSTPTVGFDICIAYLFVAGEVVEDEAVDDRGLAHGLVAQEDDLAFLSAFHVVISVFVLGCK